MYYGEARTKVDQKGRITVPRRVRETMNVMGHAVWYMARGFDHSVFLFHQETWDTIRTQVSRRSSMDAKALDFRRLFFSSVAEVRPDGQGRIAVPAHLREHASLDKEAVLIGVDDHLELWSEESWRGFRGDKDAEYKEMAAPLFGTETDGEAEQKKGGQLDES